MGIPATLSHKMKMAYMRDAASLDHGGQLDQAIQTLRGRLEQDPSSAELHHQLGLLLAQRDELPEAAERLGCAAANDPTRAEIQQDHAMVLGLLGRSEEALAALQRACRLVPWDEAIRGQLNLAAAAVEQAGGRARLHAVDPAEQADPAGDELAQMIAAHPEFLEAFWSMPAAGDDEAVFGELAEAAERAAARQPQYADLHYHRGRLYERLGRLDRADDAIGRAVAINPRYATAWIAAGDLRGQMDRPGEAARRYRRAIACGADYPDVHYKLGLTLAAAGHTGQARRAYRRALELNADYAAARQALEQSAA